ncbi:hypothetical protein F5Y06DRAFT_254481 [Hypoxylon sp. FL0890]|nr:hypothetical protein F5Y06DRAFT_254481 [Hypoxylon sp. FL0890]
MAPTSKSTSSSSSKGTANTNPAPDFTVNMNRIQTQFEAHLKAVRSFLPSRPDFNKNSANPNPNSTGQSFSALSTSANPSAPESPGAISAAAARRAAQEAEFAEERALDPNAGLGHVRAPAGNKNGNDVGKDPETARLRGRLLGKRGRTGPDGDGQQKWVRKDESSDEEQGRSGLGRAKKNGKRSRTEMGADDGAKQDSDVRIEVDAPPEVEVSAVEGVENSANRANGPESVAEDLASKPTGEDELIGAVSQGNLQKRRKKKKKKAKETPDKD